MPEPTIVTPITQYTTTTTQSHTTIPTHITTSSTSSIFNSDGTLTYEGNTYKKVSQRVAGQAYISLYL